MARESKKDKLKRYRDRIHMSQRWRKEEGFDDLWNRLIDLYSGKHFPNNMSSEDKVAVNVAFSTVNVIYPSVSVNHPKLIVWARKSEDDDRAVINETLLNYWWKHYDVKPEFRRAVKDFLIIGHGWIKTGYRFVEEDQPYGEDELQREFESMRAEADSYALQNPDLADQLPTDDEIREGLPTSKTVVVEDRPFAERVSPFDIFVDPEATSMQDLKWIAQKIVAPLEEARKDPRYKPSVRAKLRPDSEVNGRWRDESWKQGDDVKRVTVWEYWDLQTGTLCIFPELGDDFLVDSKRQPFSFGHPFEQLRNYDVPEQFYPMGDLEAIEPLQQELNETRSQMLNHRKRWARKYLYREDAFSPAGRDALASDEDNTMVPVSDTSVDLKDTVWPMPQTPLTADLYMQSEIIQGDVDLVSGVSEYLRGQLPEIRRTATEASILQDAANARAADKLAIIEETIGKVGAKLMALAQQYLTGEHVARVVGKDGLPYWVPYDRDTVRGEFDFEVEGGSTQPRNETFRRQQALEMLSALIPFVEMGILNPVELLRTVLRDGFGMKEPELLLQQQPQPMMPGGPDGPAGPGAPPLPPQPTPDQMDVGGQAIPPEILQQLQGQVGLQTALG